MVHIHRSRGGLELLLDVCQGLLEVLHEVVPYPIQRIAGLLLEPCKLEHEVTEVLHGLLEVAAHLNDFMANQIVELNKVKELLDEADREARDANRKVVRYMSDYVNEFHFDAVPEVESLDIFHTEYNLVVKRDLAQFEEKVVRIQGEAAETFKNEYIGKIRKLILQEEKDIQKLNAILKERPFGADQEVYQFKIGRSLDDSFGVYYDIFKSNKDYSDKDLFTNQLDDKDLMLMRDLFNRTDLGTFTASYRVIVPAHGTRICRAEGTRTERIRYEGETAYITAYQELKNNQTEKTGIYEYADYCSSGMKAGWLGCSERNDLIWRDVYSAAGGDYTLTLAYISGADRSITVTVNGENVQTLTGCNSGGWSTVATKSLTVTLNAGRNTVRLSNAADWMPDIDYIELQPVPNPQGIGEVWEKVSEGASSKAWSPDGRPATPQSPLRIERGRKFFKK